MTGELSSIPLKYSYSWASSIVLQLIEAHTRATEISLAILGLTPHQLTIMLATPRKEYYYIREMIRCIDKQLQVGYPKDVKPWIDMNLPWFFTALHLRLEKSNLESFKTYLTARQDDIQLKSQSLGGEGECRYSDTILPDLLSLGF